MPQRVFDVAASMVSVVHHMSGISREEAASQIWSGYADSLADDRCDIVSELVSASKAAADMLDRMEAGDRDSILAFLCHFIWFCRAFDESGRRRRFRILGGLYFTAPRTQPTDRKTRYIAKLGLYRLGLQAGTAPTAPDGWSPF